MNMEARWASLQSSSSAEAFYMTGVAILCPSSQHKRIHGTLCGCDCFRKYQNPSRINLITINWECAHVSSLLWAIRDIFEWGSSLRTGEWRMESRIYVQAFKAINHVKRILLRNGNRSPRQRYNLFCFYLFSILASFQGPGDMLLSSMSPLVLI